MLQKGDNLDYEYNLKSLTAEDMFISINKSCNTNYCTDAGGEGCLENWYEVENFDCKPTINGNCLEVSFNFFITIDLLYDRQLFTVEDFLQSLQFEFNVQYIYDGSQVESQTIIIPASIINSPDNTIKETIYRPLQKHDDQLNCDSSSYSEYKSISLTTCEKDSSVVCSDTDVYLSNITSYYIYRCTDQNSFLREINSTTNKLYCCPWYNGNSSYNGKYIGNICRPKIEEQKRWFTYFYMNYEDGVPTTTVAIDSDIIENPIVYSSYLTNASYSNFLEFNINKSGDDINNIQDIKSKLVYPIYSSTVAKNIGLIYRKYFVTEPKLKSPNIYDDGNLSFSFANAIAQPKWEGNALSINGINDNKIVLNHSADNIQFLPRNCYSVIRYMIPVDTVRPKLSSIPDLYGAITTQICDVDDGDSTTPDKKFNKKTCSFTSNIVVIKSTMADIPSDKMVTIYDDNGNSEEVLMATQVFTVFEIQNLYCDDRTLQTLIYETCKDPNYQESDATNPILVTKQF